MNIWLIRNIINLRSKYHLRLVLKRCLTIFIISSCCLIIFCGFFPYQRVKTKNMINQSTFTRKINLAFLPEILNESQHIPFPPYFSVFELLFKRKNTQCKYLTHFKQHIIVISVPGNNGDWKQIIPVAKSLYLYKKNYQEMPYFHFYAINFNSWPSALHGIFIELQVSALFSAIYQIESIVKSLTNLSSIKVILVAHSFGGLVALRTITDASEQLGSRIAAILFINVPFQSHPLTQGISHVNSYYQIQKSLVQSNSSHYSSALLFSITSGDTDEMVSPKMTLFPKTIQLNVPHIWQITFPNVLNVFDSFTHNNIFYSKPTVIFFVKLFIILRKYNGDSILLDDTISSINTLIGIKIDLEKKLRTAEENPNKLLKSYNKITSQFVPLPLQQFKYSTIQQQTRWRQCLSQHLQFAGYDIVLFHSPHAYHSPNSHIILFPFPIKIISNHVSFVNRMTLSIALPVFMNFQTILTGSTFQFPMNQTSPINDYIQYPEHFFILTHTVSLTICKTPFIQQQACRLFELLPTMVTTYPTLLSIWTYSPIFNNQTGMYDLTVDVMTSITNYSLIRDQSEFLYHPNLYMFIQTDIPVITMAVDLILLGLIEWENKNHTDLPPFSANHTLSQPINYHLLFKQKKNSTLSLLPLYIQEIIELISWSVSFIYPLSLSVATDTHNWETCLQPLQQKLFDEVFPYRSVLMNSIQVKSRMSNVIHDVYDTIYERFYNIESLHTDTIKKKLVQLAFWKPTIAFIDYQLNQIYIQASTDIFSKQQTNITMLRYSVFHMPAHRFQQQHVLHPIQPRFNHTLNDPMSPLISTHTINQQLFLGIMLLPMCRLEADIRTTIHFKVDPFKKPNCPVWDRLMIQTGTRTVYHSSWSLRRRGLFISTLVHLSQSYYSQFIGSIATFLCVIIIQDYMRDYMLLSNDIDLTGPFDLQIVPTHCGGIYQIFYWVYQWVLVSFVRGCSNKQSNHRIYIWLGLSSIISLVHCIFQPFYNESFDDICQLSILFHFIITGISSVFLHQIIQFLTQTRLRWTSICVNNQSCYLNVKDMKSLQIFLLNHRLLIFSLFCILCLLIQPHIAILIFFVLSFRVFFIVPSYTMIHLWSIHFLAIVPFRVPELVATLWCILSNPLNKDDSFKIIGFYSTPEPTFRTSSKFNFSRLLDSFIGTLWTSGQLNYNILYASILQILASIGSLTYVIQLFSTVPHYSYATISSLTASETNTNTLLLKNTLNEISHDTMSSAQSITIPSIELSSNYEIPLNKNQHEMLCLDSHTNLREDTIQEAQKILEHRSISIKHNVIETNNKKNNAKQFIRLWKLLISCSMVLLIICCSITIYVAVVNKHVFLIPLAFQTILTVVCINRILWNFVMKP